MPTPDRKSILAGVIELVVFLFAAFHGFLLNLAPPHPRVGGADPGTAVGVASLAALLVFLLVRTAFAPGRGGNRKAWLASAAMLAVFGIASVISYSRYYSAHTFEYHFSPDSSTREIYTHQYTDHGATLARQFEVHNHRPPTPEELVGYSGGDPSATPALWTPESLLNAFQYLLTAYVISVVLISLCIAAAVELLATTGDSTASASPAKDSTVGDSAVKDSVAGDSAARDSATPDSAASNSSPSP